MSLGNSIISCVGAPPTSWSVGGVCCLGGAGWTEACVSCIQVRIQLTVWTIEFSCYCIYLLAEEFKRRQWPIGYIDFWKTVPIRALTWHCHRPHRVRRIQCQYFSFRRSGDGHGMHQQKTFPSGRNTSVRVDALRQSRYRHPGGGLLSAQRQYHASHSISPSDRCFGTSLHRHCNAMGDAAKISPHVPNTLSSRSVERRWEDMMLHGRKDPCNCADQRNLRKSEWDQKLGKIECVFSLYDKMRWKWDAVYLPRGLPNIYSSSLIPPPLPLYLRTPTVAP